jgi:hypothetical protein
VQQVVVSAAVVANLVPTLGIAPADQDKFAQLLREELQHLETYNCARYRLGLALMTSGLPLADLGCDVAPP